jgi:hypothetical protein
LKLAQAPLGRHNVMLKGARDESAVLRNEAIMVSLVLAMGSAMPAVMAADVHSHEGAESQTLKLNAGKKWATDTPLRKGTTEIRDAIAKEKGAIDAGKLGDAGYDALANKIDAQVGYIVTNCKLPPEADAQLHLVLAEIMHGSSAMKGQEKGVARQTGAKKIVVALDAYSRHFDHPGWKGLAH